MNNLPAFLNTKSVATTPGSIADAAEAYRPLIGAWMLEMALVLGWYRKSHRNSMPDIFGNDYFRRTTGIDLSGISSEEDEDFMTATKTRRISDAGLRRILEQALKRIRRQKFAPDLPLFRNVE